MAEAATASDSIPELAERARDHGWWLRAVRRSPLLIVLLALQVVVPALVWTVWNPASWLKLLTTLVVLAPISEQLRSLRHGRARRLERADERAERTGRRRPVEVGAVEVGAVEVGAVEVSAVGVGSGESSAMTFTWNSAAGRVVAGHGGAWTVLGTVGALCLASMIINRPAPSPWDPLFFSASALLLVGLPIGFGILRVVGTLRSIRHVLTDPAERAAVEVIGIEPDTQRWVLERQDDRSRITVRLMAGNRQLVTGDMVQAQGALTTPARNWRRVIPPRLALAGPEGTLWAEHRALDR
jgi:hypothetical protein